MTTATFVSPLSIAHFAHSLSSSTLSSCRRRIPSAATTSGIALSPHSPLSPRPPRPSRPPIPSTSKSNLPNHQQQSSNVQNQSPSEQSKVTKVIIVPGKFDSFHIGHRRLAEIAAQQGAPTLVSFSGMHLALGWEPRPPVIAPVEINRILRDWSVSAGAPISYRLLPFDDVREMSPQQFLAFLTKQLNASAIVCGSDWRFGKSRAGDVELLKQLAPQFSLDVTIVDPVHDDQQRQNQQQQIVSSTSVRALLKQSNVSLVSSLLGRMHRVVGFTLYVNQHSVVCGEFVNMLPSCNQYHAIVRVIGRAEPIQTTVEVFEQQEEKFIRVHDARRVFCVNCEIYIDFISKVSEDGT